MKTSLRIALLLGVLSLATNGAAAQSTDWGDNQRNERSADRLLRDYDHNQDGRVTRDEMNRTIGWRFTLATHGASRMSFDEFLAARADAFRQRNAENFRSLDWNADGKLTLAEFAAGERARFVTLDRAGQGFVSCIASRATGGWRGGLSSFCADYDTNMDGRVARGELDAAVAKRFGAVAGSSGAINLAQFDLSEQQRFAVANARAFRRLDADGDGVLTVQEFGSSEVKTFARLDKNSDGVLTADELHPRTVARTDRGQRRRYD